MPVVSKKQMGLMGAIAGGNAKKKTGLSKSQAKEFLRGAKKSKLPNRAPKKKGKK